MSITCNLRNGLLRKLVYRNMNKFGHNLALKCSTTTNAAITSLEVQYEKDPSLLFTDPETQTLLKSMTQLRMDKVYRKRTVPDNEIDCKFMTTEQLDEEYLKLYENAKQLMQMPPVIKIKEDEQRVISKDPALSGFSDSKYVITDITYGIRQSERKVVVRQTDGTLQYAPLETAKRMRQLYVPLNGRKLRTPRMFHKEHLKRCLDEFKYEFILDRLCVQFEPNEKDFHGVSNQVYLHINEHKKFHDLRSTRHFGPMAFFLAWHKNIDDLLCDMIKRDFLRNGIELIALMFKLHGIQKDCSSLLTKLDEIMKPSEKVLAELRKIYAPATSSDDIHEEIKTAIGKSRDDFTADEDCLKFIDEYVKEHALKKVQLELAIQTFREVNDEKKKLYEGLRKAHGVQ